MSRSQNLLTLYGLIFHIKTVVYSLDRHQADVSIGMSDTYCRTIAVTRADYMWVSSSSGPSSEEMVFLQFVVDDEYAKEIVPGPVYACKRPLRAPYVGSVRW